MKAKWVLALLVAGMCVAAYAGNVLATTQAAPATMILGKATFPEFNVTGTTRPANLWRAKLKTHGLSDVYVVDNKFAPGTDTGWHSHPGPSMILVVSGTITNYMGDDPTCTPHTYSAGSGFIDEGGKDVHILRNESGAAAETIAVQVLQKDAVRKTDAPDPGGCHFQP